MTLSFADAVQMVVGAIRVVDHGGVVVVVVDTVGIMAL